MKNQPFNLTKALRALRQPRATASDIEAAKTRVWTALSPLVSTMDNEPKVSTARTFWNSLNISPVMLASASFVVVLLAGAGYVALQPKQSNQPVAYIPSATVRPTATIQPTATATLTPAPTASATQTSTPIPTVAPSALSQIQLSDSLISNTASISTTAATGIRNPSSAVSFLDYFFSPVHASESAFGTRAYPAIYYDTTNAIQEINVYTGASTTILTEPYAIGRVFFSTKEQSLIYTVNTTSDNAYPPVDVRVYNLNTGQTRTIATTRMHSGHLSPDGTKFGFFMTDISAPSNVTALDVYHFDSDAMQIITGSTISSAIGTIADFNWSNNDMLTVNTYKYLGAQVDLSHNSQAIVMKINIDIPGDITAVTDKTPLMFHESRIIGSKLFTNTYDMAEEEGYASISGAPPVKPRPANAQFGWLSYVDLTTNTMTDLRSQTGEFLKDWIVDSTGNKVVYSKSNLTGGTNNAYTMSMDVMDLSTKQTISLPVPNVDFLIVGWNGNENNLVLQTGSAFDNNLRYYNVDLINKRLAPITR